MRDFRKPLTSLDMLTMIAAWHEVRLRTLFVIGEQRMQKRSRVVASVFRTAGSAVDRRAPLFVVAISNPTAFSGNGSIISLELANEQGAIVAARIIARETGRCVTVRHADMGLIETIPAASTH